MATDQQVVTVVKADVSWFKAHETLILGIILILGCFWLGNRYLDNKAVEAQTAAGIAQKESDAARSQADLAAKTYQMTIEALSRQNTVLNQAVTQRQTVTKQQVATVLAPSTPIEALKALNGAYKGTVDTSGISATDAGTPAIQQFTATKIEYDADEQTIGDLNNLVSNQKNALDKSDSFIVSLNQQVTADDVTCKAQIASVKATANKSKRTWFIIGFAAGIGTRILGKF